MTADPIPLCVDLDGTLSKGDMTVESSFLLFKHKPLLFLRYLPLLVKGRAPFKRMVAENVEIDPHSIPLNRNFVEYLRREKESGRQLLLVSASDEILVKSVGDASGLFDESIGSDGVLNLKSRNKRDYLIERFGKGAFDYAGNDSADFKVWEATRHAIVVNASPKVARQARDCSSVSHEFPPEKGALRSTLKALRVHQWLKNLLVFAPLVLAHKVGELYCWGDALIAFLCFSLCASGIYVLNDIFDFESDRVHHSKKRRPVAAGDISLPGAFVLSFALLALAFLFSFAMPSSFTVCLGSYAIVTSLYSFRLKRVELVDIFILALLYVLRVLSGGVAIGVNVSHWLLGFSMFMFLSLACVKRYSELLSVKSHDGKVLKGRGYTATDIEQISTLGAASGYISVVVLAMYISSSEVMILYKSPGFLWLTCPMILYWISRVWLLAHRGKMHEDPILFAATDKVSYVVAVLSVLLLRLAM